MLSFLIDCHKTWVKITLNCSKTKGYCRLHIMQRFFFNDVYLKKTETRSFFFINKTINVDVDISSKESKNVHHL